MVILKVASGFARPAEQTAGAAYGKYRRQQNRVEIRDSHILQAVDGEKPLERTPGISTTMVAHFVLPAPHNRGRRNGDEKCSPRSQQPSPFGEPAGVIVEVLEHVQDQHDVE